MRASAVRAEGRPERPFLRCGPVGAGIEGGGASVEAAGLWSPGR